jgi:hypothetical protein
VFSGWSGGVPGAPIHSADGLRQAGFRGDRVCGRLSSLRVSPAGELGAALRAARGDRCGVDRQLSGRMAVAMEELASFDIEALISHRVPFEDAPLAYERIDTRPDESLGVLLQY